MVPFIEKTNNPGTLTHHNRLPDVQNYFLYAMKKSLIVALFALFLCGGTAFAQKSTFEKSKKLTESEVPVAVVKAFLQEHSDLQDKGYWKLHYTERNDNGRTTFTPERYTYNAKKDGEKVVLTYSVDGVAAAPKESRGKK
jgi:hypothetical protein